MNTSDYLREGYRQLQDEKFYTKIKEDPTTQVQERINKILNSMKQKGFITEKKSGIPITYRQKSRPILLTPKNPQEKDTWETHLQLC